ncbi:hypothetical protein ES707_20807 [subsurface metagenome]
MEYGLTEEQKTIKSLARKIAEERILPVRAELDETEEFPWAIMKDLADADMLRVFIPAEYDGLGGGCLELCLIVEEISRVCGAVATCYAVNAAFPVTVISCAMTGHSEVLLTQLLFSGPCQNQLLSECCLIGWLPVPA